MALKSITTMARIGIFILFFFLFPLLLLSQEKDSAWYSQKAEELYDKGLQLYGSGKEFESIDTLLLSLEFLKKNLGDENTEFVNVYNALGIINRNLNRNDDAITYFQLSEKNYKLNKEINPSVLAGLYINIGNHYQPTKTNNLSILFLNYLFSSI